LASSWHYLLDPQGKKTRVGRSQSPIASRAIQHGRPVKSPRRSGLTPVPNKIAPIICSFAHFAHSRRKSRCQNAARDREVFCKELGYAEQRAGDDRFGVDTHFDQSASSPVVPNVPISMEPVLLEVTNAGAGPSRTPTPMRAAATGQASDSMTSFPASSLFFEILINVIYALVLRKPSGRAFKLLKLAFSCLVVFLSKLIVSMESLARCFS
jgi:hypothetical protein